MAKGRHADGESGGFYRDLAMMVVGILLVGAAVFVLLFLLVGDGSNSTTTASDVPSTTTITVGSTTTTLQTTTTKPNTTTSSEAIVARPPSEVRVVVLNSIGVAGIAGGFTNVLGDAGYQTLQPADYEPQQDPTRIWYRDGFSAEASMLLDLIPGAVAEPLPDAELEPGADIVVVLGVGYEE